MQGNNNMCSEMQVIHLLTTDFVLKPDVYMLLCEGKLKYDGCSFLPP